MNEFGDTSEPDGHDSVPTGDGLPYAEAVEAVPTDPASAVLHSPPSSCLKTHGLGLNYGNVRAVHNLNLEVREGEIYGFLGRNGAGKTSTIRMIMGVIRPDAGEIELNGERLRRIGTRQKRNVGYVSQEQNFYPWMKCAQLGKFVGGFYPTWDRAEFARLLHILDLPPGRRVAHLSGGMKVKLALALALAHRPSLLILDEPTSGLDPVARREFLNIIRQQSVAHGRTTFFSSHLIDEVEMVADRVGIIKRGQLCYEGEIGLLHQTVRKVVCNERQPANIVRERAIADGFEEMDGFRGQLDAVYLRGEPDLWQASSVGDFETSPISLEDVFVALVGEPTPNL